MTQNRQHLFIAGSGPRTGTTLLQLMLSAHPGACISPETYLIQEALKITDPQTLDLDTRRMLDIAREDWKLNSWPRFVFSDFAALFEGEERTSARALIERLVALHAANLSKAATVLGNKKGLYASELAHLVKKIFPEAKFLFSYRDPRDTVPSILKNIRNQGLAHVLADLAQRHRAINELLAAYPGDCLVVRFEDLVTDAETQCRRICGFLALPYDRAMLEYYAQNQDGELLLGATAQIHQRTRGPLVPSVIGEWKTRLPQGDVAEVEAMLGGVMDQYGYERACARTHGGQW